MFGRRRLPAGARPPLDKDERIVAWAQTAGDGVLVATTRGVWLPGRERRLGWHEIHKAAWSGSTLSLTPAVEVSSREGYTVMADDSLIILSLTDPGDVPYEVRKRVTRSVAYTAHYPLPGATSPESGVRVVARRVPGVDGVTWHVRYDQGVDAHDPDIVSATDELVSACSASFSRADD